MTRFMLDTNICVDVLRQGRFVDRIVRHDPQEIAVSTIVLSELHYGAAKSSNPARAALAVMKLAGSLCVLPFDNHAAQTYGQVRARLEQQGTPIGALDTLIAAHALSLGMTLVTNNEREFARVTGLTVENWLRAVD